jgi:hypothetical protein
LYSNIRIYFSVKQFPFFHQKKFWEIFWRIFFSSVNLTIFLFLGKFSPPIFLHHKNQKNFFPKKLIPKRGLDLKVCLIWPGEKKKTLEVNLDDNLVTIMIV